MYQRIRHTRRKPPDITTEQYTTEPVYIGHWAGREGGEHRGIWI